MNFSYIIQFFPVYESEFGHITQFEQDRIVYEGSYQNFLRLFHVLGSSHEIVEKIAQRFKIELKKGRILA